VSWPLLRLVECFFWVCDGNFHPGPGLLWVLRIAQRMTFFSPVELAVLLEMPKKKKKNEGGYLG
jgi:hypothetical protein